MGLANKTSVILVICIFCLTACSVKQSITEPKQSEPKKQLKPHGQPNPKARPKIAPSYPPANIVIAWHATQCGGYKANANQLRYIGENELKNLFKSICLLGETEPEKVLTQLEQSNRAYYWPDDIKQYLWLQKQYVQQSLAAKQAKQALSDEMEKTLSSLAIIEQQLLLREEAKEQ